VVVIDLLYVFYMSGMIGKLKGIVCDNGGYVVVLCWLMMNVFGV